MRSWLLRLAAIALLLGLPPALMADSALACSCVESDPAEEFEWADVVVAGKAVSRGAIGAPAKFQVSRVWKGGRYATRSIDVGGVIRDDGSVSINTCDPRFEQGEEYLVFALEEPGGTLQTSRCGVFLLEHAQAYLNALGAGEPPVPGMVPAEANSDSGFPSWAIGLIAVAAGLLVVGTGFAAISRRRGRQT